MISMYTDFDDLKTDKMYSIISDFDLTYVHIAFILDGEPEYYAPLASGKEIDIVTGEVL